MCTSGSTEHLRLLADKAKGEDAKVVLITTKPDSKIGEIADTVIELPAGTKYDAEGSEQPLGSLFEQSAQIFLDAVVLDLMEIFNIERLIVRTLLGIAVPTQIATHDSDYGKLDDGSFYLQDEEFQLRSRLFVEQIVSFAESRPYEHLK